MENDHKLPILYYKNRAIMRSSFYLSNSTTTSPQNGDSLPLQIPRRWRDASHYSFTVLRLIHKRVDIFYGYGSETLTTSHSTNPTIKANSTSDCMEYIILSRPIIYVFVDSTCSLQWLVLYYIFTIIFYCKYKWNYKKWNLLWLGTYPFLSKVSWCYERHFMSPYLQNYKTL
jgi:hypothetical protein